MRKDTALSQPEHLDAETEHRMIVETIIKVACDGFFQDKETRVGDEEVPLPICIRVK